MIARATICPTSPPGPAAKRPEAAPGLTLLEVILGLAIFVGSIAILSQLVHLGIRATRYAQLQTRAVMLAESKMNEIVAGLVSTDSVGVQQFEQDPAWQWQLTTDQGTLNGLLWVTVTVTPAPGGELAEYAGEIKYTLGRCIFDASVIEEALAESQAESGEQQ